MLMILKYHFRINLGPGAAKVPGFFIFIWFNKVNHIRVNILFTFYFSMIVISIALNELLNFLTLRPF